MLFVAEQVRLILAEMGFRRLDDLVGRRELLMPRDPDAGGPLELWRLLCGAGSEGRRLPRLSAAVRPARGQEATELERRILEDCRPAISGGGSVRLDCPITNRDRAVGTRLAGEVVRRRGAEELPPETVTLDFRGTAGQSFGAFLVPGLHLRLTGDAQDYVGKGMSGGEIVLRPPAGAAPHGRAVDVARFESHRNVIAGNTLLYGATGGSLYAAGQVGERFCVRNSGALAVVEGCGDHGCEYMTRGVAVILGPTGRNFGAGMSGGVAFVYDEDGRFVGRVNPGMVSVEDLAGDEDRQLLRRLLSDHAERTGSRCAASLLANWKRTAKRFCKVVPLESPESSDAPRRIAGRVASRTARKREPNMIPPDRL